MRFACDSCGAQYMIADEKVGVRGVKVKCKKCGNMIVVKPGAEAAASSMADTGSSAGVASGGMSSMSAAGQGGSFGDTQTQAPQGELGGAFSSMFGSSEGQPEQQPAQDNGVNGSYGNGNHDAGGDNNAFGFQSSFGGAGGGDTDMALGQLEQQQAPVSSDRGGERVWYVAIEDAQVGPVNLSEVEERWDGKEIDEDTLVWKAGMADWIPLVDVPELAYLITERPQAQRGSMARAGASAAAGSSLGMQGYGASSPQEMADEPSWRPSAASALSSLVQEELVAKKPDAPEPLSAPKGMEGLNIGANDIFGSGGDSGGTPITVGTPAAEKPASAPVNDSFSSSGSPAWSVPSARRNSGSGMGTKVVVGLLFVAVLGLGGFMFHMMQQQPKETVVIREIEKAPPTPPPAPVDPTAPPVAPPMPTPPVAAKDPNTATAKPKHNDGDRGDRGDKSPAGEKPTKGKGKPESTDPLEQIDNAQKNTPAAAAVKEALSKEDIIDGVKANGSKLGPCVTAARSKEEIQPGRVQFVLDWTINPNGSVTAARLKGPQEVMNTSLPSCFARVMGSWKFAASKNGAPITNFPLPITVR